MNNQNVVTHRIKAGDNLYNLARHYNTSVAEILNANPGIDPYRLVINTDIYIYPNDNGTDKYSLKEDMRKAWMEHVFWTRLLIISILDNLKDTSFTTNRLLQNPKDIADIFGRFYNPNVRKTIEDLIREHLVIGEQLVKAYKSNDVNNINRLNREWYQNADSIARGLSSINPNYNENDLRDMLYDHLNLVKQEVGSRLSGNYNADVAAADNAINQAVNMADMFTEGIAKQFNL